MACTAVGLSRATYYRASQEVPKVTPRQRRTSQRRLSEEERATVLDVLDSDEFIDQPPREVYARLWSRGAYLCSVSTMYRILRERGPVRERRQQKQRTKHPVPRLESVAPNQVWTWDITKLATFTHGVFLNLYVILDLYSRFVVAWMLAERENSALAIQLLRDAITRYDIPAAQLSVHQDRGAPMRAVGFQQVLQDLGVSQSYSRPRVSNDNPYSEAHFRTLKYQSDYPHRFRGVQEARIWCADFFAWYNEALIMSALGCTLPPMSILTEPRPSQRRAS